MWQRCFDSKQACKDRFVAPGTGLASAKLRGSAKSTVYNVVVVVQEARAAGCVASPIDTGTNLLVPLKKNPGGAPAMSS